MIEAQSQLQLTRVRNRWMRYELVVVDELGYVVMPDAAAELLFQVIEVDRLGEELEGSEVPGAPAAFVVAIGGHHHDRQLREALFDLTEQL